MVSRHNRLMRELYKKNFTADVQQPMRFNNPFLIQSSQVLLSNILKKQTMDAATAAAKATATAAPVVTAATTPAAESKPAEAKPAESKPAEAKPAESKPAEAKPAEAKPAEAKPAESKPPASGTGVSSRPTDKATLAAKVKAKEKADAAAANAKAKAKADAAAAKRTKANAKKKENKAKKAAAAKAKLESDAAAAKAKLESEAAAAKAKLEADAAAAKQSKAAAKAKLEAAAAAAKQSKDAIKAITDKAAKKKVTDKAKSPTTEPPVLDKTYKHLSEEDIKTIKALYKTKTDLENKLTAQQRENSQWAIANQNKPKGQKYRQRLISNTQKENEIASQMNKNNAKIKTLEDKEAVGSTSGRRTRGRGTESFETLTINSAGTFIPFVESSTLYKALSPADKAAYNSALKKSIVSQKAFKELQEQTAKRLAKVPDNAQRKKITDDTETKLKTFQEKYNDAIKTVTKIREKEVTIAIPTTKKSTTKKPAQTPPTTGPFAGLSVRGTGDEFKGIDKKSREFKDLLPEQKAAYNDAAKNANAAAKSFLTMTNRATKEYKTKKDKELYKTRTNAKLNDIRLRYKDAVEKAVDALGPFGDRLKLRGSTASAGGTGGT